MAITMEDMWGDLSLEESIETPYTLLKQQADLLTQKTNGLLVGIVARESPIYSYKIPNAFERHSLSQKARDDLNDFSRSNPVDHFILYLRIKVPFLRDYTFSILKIAYPSIKHYPAIVASTIDIDRDSPVFCRDMEQLTQAIREIIQRQDVQRAIRSLWSEAQETQATE